MLTFFHACAKLVSSNFNKQKEKTMTSEIEVYLADGTKTLISEIRTNDVVEITLYDKLSGEKTISPCVIAANESGLPQRSLTVKSPGNCGYRMIKVPDIKRVSVLQAIHVFNSYDGFIRSMEKRIQELSHSVQ
jgi:hypothetical protein